MLYCMIVEDSPPSARVAMKMAKLYCDPAYTHPDAQAHSYLPNLHPFHNQIEPKHFVHHADAVKFFAEHHKEIAFIIMDYSLLKGETGLAVLKEMATLLTQTDTPAEQFPFLVPNSSECKQNIELCETWPPDRILPITTIKPGAMVNSESQLSLVEYVRSRSNSVASSTTPRSRYSSASEGPLNMAELAGSRGLHRAPTPSTAQEDEPPLLHITPDTPAPPSPKKPT